MKHIRWSGKIGRWLVTGLIALAGLAPAQAQDNSVDKPEPPAVAIEPVEPAPEPAQPEENGRRHWRRHHDDVRMVGNDFILKEDETAGDVVVVSGNAIIKGHVTGGLIVVAGSATVEGKVDGDVHVILGSATLGPGAEIDRDVTVVGGTLRRDPTSRINGTPNVVSANIGWLRNYTVHGLMWARPIAPQVSWVWAVVGIFLLIYLLIAVMFPRPIQACVDTLEKRPVGSFFMGLLLFILVAPLTFLLAISIVGIPVIPFLFCAMIVAFLFGKVAVYRFAGAQVGSQFHLAALQLPVVAFLIGALIFCLLYTIPFLGFLIWGAVIPFGMGAAVLAAFGGMRREGNGRSNSPAPVAVPGAAAPIGAAPPIPASGIPVPPLVAGMASPAELISMPRAGFWLRTFATILDMLLFVFLVIIVHQKALLLWIVYHVAMWAWKGTTVGGMVVGIKLIRVDGRPVDVGVALVRAAVAIFSALVGGLGFFWAGWNRDKQSWHDKIAGTLMVTVPKGMPLF